MIDHLLLDMLLFLFKFKSVLYDFDNQISMTKICEVTQWSMSILKSKHFVGFILHDKLMIILHMTVFMATTNDNFNQNNKSY